MHVAFHPEYSFENEEVELFMLSVITTLQILEGGPDGRISRYEVLFLIDRGNLRAIPCAMCKHMIASIIIIILILNDAVLSIFCI